MSVQELLFLFNDAVYLFMESQQLLRVHHLVLLGETFCVVVGAGSQRVLEVVPVFLLLLLLLLLVAYLVCLLGLRARWLVVLGDVAPLGSLLLFFVVYCVPV